MIKAETLLIDYASLLVALEKLIDAELSQKRLEFTLSNGPVLSQLSLRHIIDLLKRYQSEGGFAKADVCFYPARDQRDEPGYYKFIFELPHHDERTDA